MTQIWKNTRDIDNITKYSREGFVEKVELRTDIKK